MSVRDYMTRKVITIQTESTILDAIKLLRKFKVKGFRLLMMMVRYAECLR